jgi:hypothetical protein
LEGAADAVSNNCGRRAAQKMQGSQGARAPSACSTPSASS